AVQVPLGACRPSITLANVALRSKSLKLERTLQTLARAHAVKLVQSSSPPVRAFLFGAFRTLFNRLLSSLRQWTLRYFRPVRRKSAREQDSWTTIRRRDRHHPGRARTKRIHGALRHWHLRVVQFLESHVITPFGTAPHHTHTAGDHGRVA